MCKYIHILIGLLILLSSSIYAEPAAQLNESTESISLEPDNYLILNNFDKETDRFLKAKAYVFKREWETAIGRLEAYLKAYPSGIYKDEALYWLARSLDKLSTNQESLEKVIKGKESAEAQLNTLTRDYQESLWQDDAKILQTKLAEQLHFLTGKRGPDVESDNELFNLSNLTEMNDEVVVTALERYLTTQRNKELRKRIVSFLGKHYPDQAADVLNEAAQNDSDQEVRDTASQIIQQIKMEKIPVHLSYLCYSAQIKDENEWKRLPERTPTMFDLPRAGMTNKKNVEKVLKSFFNNRLKDIKLVNASFGGLSYKYNFQFKTDFSEGLALNLLHNEPLNIAINKYIQVQPNINLKFKDKFNEYLKYFTIYYSNAMSHDLHGIRISPLSEGLIKEYDQISGNACFYDIEKEKEHNIFYTVDEFSDKLLVMRKGDKVALMVLQFDPEEDDEEKELVYHTKFGDVFGCTVHSSRQNWNMGAMSKTDGVMDFGAAKVEIPDEEGTWRLEGNILSDGKTKRFIGRNATLYNPQNKIVVQAAQIIVPVNNPGKHEVIGKKEK